jgi:hypothetical protein
MRKLTTTMFIALIIAGLIVMGNLPVMAANTTSTTESASFSNALNFLDGSYRLPGNTIHTFKYSLNRGHVDIVITGDGSTDLDLYVYDDGGRLVGSSDGNSDDEKVCLTIIRSSIFKVKVINRSSYANDYRIIVK